MVTLLYHSRSVGYVCKRIATNSGGKISAVCDRMNLPARLDGTIIRWDSYVPLQADRTINTREAILLSRNKKAARLAMRELSPTTWIRYRDLGYPCLIRPKRHYAARNFFICHNRGEAWRVIQRRYRRWYASPIIAKKFEYRVFVFQGYVTKVVRRFHDDLEQVAWNIANGGRSARLKHESWPIDCVKKVILAGRRLTLDWFAADVMVDDAGRSFVSELNTAPGLQRDTTIKNLSKIFIWAGEHEVPPLNDLMGDTWKSYIHPALQ